MEAQEHFLLLRAALPHAHRLDLTHAHSENNQVFDCWHPSFTELRD